MMGGGCPWFRSGRGGRLLNPIGSMERDNCEIRMKQCVSRATKHINKEQEITGFYGVGGMEVFSLTSIRHSVKLCTSSYIQEKLAPVSLLHARSVLVKIT